MHSVGGPFFLHGRKVYKYVLSVVDVASQYKEAESLTLKDSVEDTKAFPMIQRSPLTWPEMPSKPVPYSLRDGQKTWLCL